MPHRWPLHLSQASTYSLLLLIAAALLLQFRNILGAIGSWLILGTFLLVIGALVIGYFSSIGSGASDRKTVALGTASGISPQPCWWGPALAMPRRS
jgi:NhaP-type Na+/H+ or K+/H+ antiporter